MTNARGFDGWSPRAKNLLPVACFLLLSRWSERDLGKVWVVAQPVPQVPEAATRLPPPVVARYQLALDVEQLLVDQACWPPVCAGWVAREVLRERFAAAGLPLVHSADFSGPIDHVPVVLMLDDLEIAACHVPLPVFNAPPAIFGHRPRGEA